MYKYGVSFKNYEGWSKPYTYLSEKDYRKNQEVLVPVSNNHAVGKTVSKMYTDKVQAPYELKFIIASIEEIKELLNDA